MTKPTHDQAMAGYAVACKYGVLEGRAFDLVDDMFEAFGLESKEIVIDRDEFGIARSVSIRNGQGVLKMIEKL